jgi:type II secretory pathway pseudopilin PulG
MIYLGRGRLARPTQGPRARTEQAGFTMAETALAMTVLLVALISASAATLRTHALQRENREKVVAHNALRTQAEQLHATATRLAEQTEDLDTWVGQVQAQLSDTFDVPELLPALEGEAVGSILLITDETLTDEDLGIDIGMPRDLNGDGDALDADVSTSARVLPVIVRVDWLGGRGIRRLDHGFYVLAY